MIVGNTYTAYMYMKLIILSYPLARDGYIILLPVEE